jgi:hypothetical protein
MIYEIIDLKSKNRVDQFVIKGIILPNLNIEEMFEYCQRIMDQFQEQLDFLKPLNIEKFKKNLILQIQKTSQRKQLYLLLEENCNLLLEHEDDQPDLDVLKQNLRLLTEFQKFLLTYLWRVESKYKGQMKF